MPLSRRGRAAIAIVVAALLATLLWRAGAFSLGNAQRLQAFVLRIREAPASGFTFVVLYAIAACLMVPVTPLTLAGGIIFGTANGIVLNWCGDMAGAALAFALVRAIGWKPKRLDALPGEALADRGFLALLRLRVIPVVPFSLLNVGAAVYGMRWRPFLLATGIGLLPTTIVYTWFAASLAAGVAGANRRALIAASIAGAAIILLSFLPKLVAAARKPK